MTHARVDHARELAHYLENYRDDDGAQLGVTDAELCVRALKAYGNRRRNRAAMAVAATIAIAIGWVGFGLPGDGNTMIARASIRVPAAMPCTVERAAMSGELADAAAGLPPLD